MLPELRRCPDTGVSPLRRGPIFTSFLGSGVAIVGEILVTQGIQENAAVRQAGMVTFLFNLLLALIAMASVLLTVPKGRKYGAD
nr:hypothetical protein [uncultured Actinotalea sp.]